MSQQLRTPVYMQAPEHMYIHWPFCSKKCHYCDFVALEQHESYQDAYAQALQGEVALFAQEHRELLSQKEFKTIYIGGGTPSLCPPEHLQTLFSLIKKEFNCQLLQECTLEANPADITEKQLDLWTEVGINRLSIGVQALDDDLLLKLNRRQRVSDVIKSMNIVTKYIKNNSIDLILGLPGVSEKAWKETLQKAVDWPITHISIYFLTIHEKTPLYFKVQKGEVTLTPDDTLIKLYEYTIDFLACNGFEQYEISNFARKGFYSQHNQAYWNYKPYRGFGLGASSFNGQTRFSNTGNLLSYIAQNTTALSTTCSFLENLSQEQQFTEKLMLGLRQRQGLDVHAIINLLSPNQEKKFFSGIQRLNDEGLLYWKDEKIVLTHKGMILENEIIVMLM